MRNTWKRNCSAGMALLLGGSLMLGGCGSNEVQETAETSAVVVDMEEAHTGKLTLQNSFVGTVSPQELVYVIPFASGTVTDTYFEVGDQVNAGDVLFQIDDSAAKLQLEQAQLNAVNVRQQADSALTTQQESANIQMDSSRVQAQSGYDQAEIAYYNVLNNYNDVDDNIDKCEDTIKQLQAAIQAASVSGGDAAGVATLQAQLTEVQKTKESLEATKKSLTPSLQQAESAYRAAKESMGIVDRSQALSQGQALEDTKKQLSTGEKLANIGVESAELALSYYTVKAPISGTIQSKGVEVNGIAGSSSPAYTIANENMMTVTFQVSEAVKNTLSIGQEVTVERGTTGYTGNITEIGVAVNQQTGLFQIKAAVAANGSELPSGVSVKLTTDTYHTSDSAVLIPYDAVYYDNTGSYVYLSVDGKAVKTYVTTDLFDDTQISVTEGVQPGDTVITSWSPKLMNGVEVTAPVKAEE